MLLFDYILFTCRLTTCFCSVIQFKPSSVVVRRSLIFRLDDITVLLQDLRLCSGGQLHARWCWPLALMPSSIVNTSTMSNSSLSITTCPLQGGLSVGMSSSKSITNWLIGLFVFAPWEYSIRNKIALRWKSTNSYYLQDKTEDDGDAL